MAQEIDWWSVRRKLIFPDLVPAVVRLKATAISNAMIERAFSIIKHRTRSDRLSLSYLAMITQLNIHLTRAHYQKNHFSGYCSIAFLDLGNEY